jgi:hypothetical protein
MSSFETLILKWVLILSGSLVVPENDEDSDEYQKGTFLRQHFPRSARENASTMA